MGPSLETHVHPRTESEEDCNCYGVLVEDSPVIPSKEDREIANALENVNSKNSVSLNWPAIDDVAVSEYNTEKKIFTTAFFWLFPGGVGDYNDFRPTKISADQWAKRLMTYEDGRFERDNFFTFYVANYCIRRRNQSQGNFFYNMFSGGTDCDLQTLQENITNGNTTFVDEITYFCKLIKGSDAFWREKRSELHTWILHHVDMGNGMPQYFITLSCAEYFWPDIIRLVEERHFIATGEKLNLNPSSKNRIQLMNEYTIVVQEYFQKRVEMWIDTVGKDIFGIQHYWLRYEFAPGRGQIHAHIIAISDDKAVLYSMHEHRNNAKKQAEILSTWASEKMKLTAKHQHIEERDMNPCNKAVAKNYSDINDHRLDIDMLKEETEMHDCSGYCLRETSKKEKEIYCREHNLDK